MIYCLEYRLKLNELIFMKTGKNILDEELFRRIKCNDSIALKVLYEKYYSSLCYFSSKFVKNTEIAEEVVSDVFLNIWMKRGRIEIRTSLKIYLYTSVRNRSLNYLKQIKIDFEDLETADKENKSSELGADRIINYEELNDKINHLLKQLPEKREIVFRLNRVNGLSYKEISEILSISINTVQNQMVRAVKFLSDQYPRFKKLFIWDLLLIIK